jgi:hypothetical protein
MKQLGVLDTAFINLEHANTPQHVGGLGIYDPSTAPGGAVRFKGVIANFERRLHKHTIFRSRLVKVPGNVDRPYWVQDANFDVEFHIRHIALPQPGDWRQLCILVARLHARPLDMNRPLWEAYIIEGLDNIPGVPVAASPSIPKCITHLWMALVARQSCRLSTTWNRTPRPCPKLRR